jgi:serine/threonine protein kinase
LGKELIARGARFELIGVLGEGQSATVFKAVRKDEMGYSQRLVALKVCKDPSTVAWMRREFETLAKVKSKYCVQLLAWEIVDNQAALALELVDGVSLLDLGRRYRMTPELIDEIVAQVQLGLSDIWSHQLFHGDLSPNNILIDREGCIRLVDFGTQPITQASGSVRRGTPAYLAPEIWAGEKASAASDLFALGLIAHDLKNRFEDVPGDFSRCERRAKEFAKFAYGENEETGWLALDPERRRPRSLRSNSRQQAALAGLVRERLLERDQMKTSTLPHSSPGKRLSSWRVALVFLLVFAAGAGLPVRADAPLVDIHEDAFIRIQSYKWMRVSLDGKDLGYAPIRRLKIRSGVHRIRWQNQAEKGELRLNLAPGADLVLSDKEIRRLTASRQSGAES